MSNRRRLQHPAAHLDGLRLTGSCCNTVINIQRRGVINLQHDDDCPVLGDDPEARDSARIVCMLALQAATPGTVGVVQLSRPEARS